MKVYVNQVAQAPTVTPPVVTGIVAAAGGPSSATPLTAPCNIVTETVTGGAVILTAIQGMRMTVVADAGAAFLVYPSEDTAFKGMDAGEAVTLQDGATAEWLWDGAGTWYRNAPGVVVT